MSPFMDSLCSFAILAAARHIFKPQAAIRLWIDFVLLTSYGLLG
jgi:hypothetical protein